MSQIMYYSVNYEAKYFVKSERSKLIVIQYSEEGQLSNLPKYKIKQVTLSQHLQFLPLMTQT